METNEKPKMTEENFRQQVERLLKHEFMRGMESGVYAVCQVLLRKAIEKDKTADERLLDVVKFCMTAKKPGRYETGKVEEKLEQAGDAKAVEKVENEPAENSDPANEIQLPASEDAGSDTEDAQ